MSGFGTTPASLAPHPWDQFGPAPKLGPAYQVATATLPPDVMAAALEAASKLREAYEAEEEIDALQGRQHLCERESEAAFAKFEADYPNLADAIRDEPEAFDYEDGIREWLSENVA